jgi:hypothetical protein
VHPQTRGKFWPATATTGVHVGPKESPLVTGGERIPAWLVINDRKLVSLRGGRLQSHLPSAESSTERANYTLMVGSSSGVFPQRLNSTLLVGTRRAIPVPSKSGALPQPPGLPDRPSPLRTAPPGCRPSDRPRQFRCPGAQYATRDAGALPPPAERRAGWGGQGGGAGRLHRIAAPQVEEIIVKYLYHYHNYNYLYNYLIIINFFFFLLYSPPPPTHTYTHHGDFYWRFSSSVAREEQ